MEQTLARTIWVIFLQAQGLGGLLLILVCGTLYAHRRRSYFLYWTLAWFALSLSRFFSGLALGAHWLTRPTLEGHVWLPYAAAVCGWWHVNLWIIGLLHLRHVYQSSMTSPAGSGPEQPSAPPSMWAALRWLAITAMLAALVQGVMPGASPGVLSGAMAVTYGASAVWFARRWWHTGQLGVLLLPVSLGMCALARLYTATLATDTSTTSEFLTVLYYSALIDFVLQTFTVVAMIVVLLGDEDALLRQTGERLAEFEDRFRLLFEHGGVGMALLTPQGDFIQVNPALVQMLGYPVAEMLGLPVSEFMHPEDRGSIFRLKQTPAEPQYEREKRFLHRDGRVVWARIVRVPVRDAHGSVRYHACVFVDVTERKQAEEALGASEQRLRLRFQEAFDGICLWSPGGTFLDANPALCRLLGLSREDLLGRNIAEVSADGEVVQRHLRNVLDLSSDRCETRLFSRGGSLVDVEVNSAVLEVEGQRFIQGICRDISARKRAEAALRQAELELREERDVITQILQTADALILVVDPEGRILRFNDKCRAVSGYREEEVRGQSFWDCLLPERVVQAARDSFRGLLDSAKEEASRVFERPWRTRGGDERLIAWRWSLVRDARGHIPHVIGIGLDVTDQRRLEEQVARARKMETLGTLVGGIAHDFNNQLTAILGNLSLVLCDLQKLRSSDYAAPGGQPANHAPEELDASLESSLSTRHFPIEELLPCVLDAERAAQRCARMTARLLTFSRGRLGTMQPVALDQVLAETVRALQPELSSDIQVEVRAVPDLWPVAVDVAQVQELLLNLATNACDAMPDGGILTLSVANRLFTAEDCAANLDARLGSFVELCVSDTGCGMTPEVRERLFEPFFTTKKVGHGLGLGLSVVFGIVKGHKGWITVHSEPGEGASFHVYLPVVEARAPAARPTPPSFPAQAGEGQILVVDDEPMVRDLARTVLERWGFRVLTAAGGEEALDICSRQANAIDVILLDYIMPGMNGVQVLKELLLLDPEVCVIFSSGYSMDHEIDQLLAAGARGFVAKPYRPLDLVQAIRQAMAHRLSTVGQGGRPIADS